MRPLPSCWPLPQTAGLPVPSYSDATQELLARFSLDIMGGMVAQLVAEEEEEARHMG